MHGKEVVFQDVLNLGTLPVYSGLPNQDALEGIMEQDLVRIGVPAIEDIWVKVDSVNGTTIRGKVTEHRVLYTNLHGVAKGDNIVLEQGHVLEIKKTGMFVVPNSAPAQRHSAA
ncbi:hypothetical protein ACYPKM_00050 [Pseudomonas aeruginosa]